jgi:3-dehydroquinate dehydratase
VARTILFAFWGRRDNVEIQLPFIRRILAENPEVEFHGWDLCRDPADSKYLRTIEGDRITIQTAFYGPPASRGQVRVWRHYTASHYRDCTFVKIDDDCLFIETSKFGDFVQSVNDNPNSVVSALTINNGASTPHIPALWDIFQQLDIPLLDVHLSAEYAQRCHEWFHTHWQTLTDQPTQLIPSQTWLSINFIGYRWAMGQKIATLLGTRSPSDIADRTFPRRNANGRIVGHRVGDEGAVNMFPRLINTGMAVAHFTFGPQHFTDDVAAELRAGYAEVARQYLGANGFGVESNVLAKAARTVLPTPIRA